MKTINNLQNVVLFNLSVSLWTGQKKLTGSDVQTDLPQDLGSLGHKKTVSPEALAPLGTIKKRMETILSNYGIRFLGGYAIPKDHAAAVAKELDEQVQHGLAAKATFLSNYDSEVESWIKQHPTWEERIRAAITPRAYVDGRIKFGYEAFTVSVVDGLTDGLSNQAAKMGQTLLDEVSSEIQELVERSVVGKIQVNRRILVPIRRLRGKLFGLSFLDTAVTPLVTLMDQTLSKMPQDGPISGTELSILSGALLILSSADRMRSHAEKINSGFGLVDDADDLVDASAPATDDLFANAAPAVPAPVAVANASPAPAPAPVVSAPAVPDVDANAPAAPAPATRVSAPVVPAPVVVANAPAADTSASVPDAAASAVVDVPPASSTPAIEVTAPIAPPAVSSRPRIRIAA